MKRLVLAIVLAFAASAPSQAQTPVKPQAPSSAPSTFTSVTKIELKGSKPAPAPKTAATIAAALGAVAPPEIAPQGTDKVPFGCDARSPNLCHFRIFYPRGSRNVTLLAGMKAKIPQVKVGRDGYCVAVNAKPAPKCARKIINAKYNS